VPRDTVLNRVVPEMRLGFIGDILPLRDARFTIDPEVRGFLRDVDYLVGNFEGTLTGPAVRSVFMAQAHKDDTLELLNTLAPANRTVLLCANNHSGDFGKEGYHHSVQRLRASGYRVTGEACHRQLRLRSGIELAAGTAWSNRPAQFVADLDTASLREGSNGSFGVLCPHWGYELETTPRRRQISQAADWLRRWDLVVGHHSHTPQPLVVSSTPDGRRLVAYSLGNFTFGYDLRHHCQGIALIVDIGRGQDGQHQVGRVAWIKTMIDFGRARRARVRARP
jgi:poly-gamma-glutamate capsule biosynthesis protein CapA/YwtB (metallophosphatase superfamily)